MRIALRLPGRLTLRWHADLIDRLAAQGHEIDVLPGTGADALPPELRLLAWFERHVFGRALESLDPAPRPGAAAAGGHDLVVDLTGSDGPGDGTPVLQPRFDGSAEWSHLYDALLRERPPTIEIVRAPEGLVAQRGEAAVSRPALLSTSLDAVLTRTSVLIAAAVRVAEEGGPAVPSPAWPDAKPGRPLAFAARHLAQGAMRKLRQRVERPAHWRIGWRPVAAGGGVLDRLAWPADGYRWLDTGAADYAADPFVLDHEGVVHVFCEVFAYADPIGKIAVFTIGPDGTPGALRTVLERPYHLSYPMVFRRDGQIWMIPETYQNRTVELYRAERFPDVWTLEAVLFEGVELSDVTLAEHDGRFWLFASDSARGATSWDCLSLFMAQDIRGPWRPHPANPVLVDARAARPAGFMERRGGALLRPAQDCRAGYGAGLSICRVDRLDPEGYAQTVLATLRPMGARDTGAHTVNVGGGFEVIDHCGPMRRV
ncbi:glucosamine inositolphosphorylceramide transferase family protein [Alsobacter sp. SYSU BS001988]